MRIKVKNINHLNDILFYGGFGKSKELTVIMNRNTLENFVLDFNKEFHNKIAIWDKKWDDPDWFAQHNGILIAIGEWLEDGEVDIKI